MTVAVIPAAGLGTRFLPVSKCVPKEMLPLVDVPVIDVVISEAVAAGCEEIVIVSSPSKPSLDAYFRAAPTIEARLRAESRSADLALVRRGETMAQVTVVHQPEPRGNGDAILRARDTVRDRPFLVIWADTVSFARPPFAAQLIRVRERLGGGAVLGVRRVRAAEARRHGIVDGDPVGTGTWRIRHIREKPDELADGLAVAHGYVLESEIFRVLERLPPGRAGEIWLTDALNILAPVSPIHAYELEGEGFDTGDRLGYVQAFIETALRRPELRDELRSWLVQRMRGGPS